ncbi:MULTISPECIES: PAS domain-containing protein [Aquimarina]|uniref:PAS domain-containing protein n=1 Tax=Aquimarina algiphila TaxID=2047982 RepID=A0A554VFS2_9FLAO|nr:MULTISPECIES: PAS domain-containing protein [Aquimarina]TSE06097.1 PAS domain-containing protein [Aquimarina algiphila]
MSEFSVYDHMMAEYYKKMSNYTLPLLSWEFYGEDHTTLGFFKDDIGTLKKITKNWQFERNYYKEFVEEQSVIVITNTNLKIVYASQNIEKMNGYSPEEVIGNSPKMFQGNDTCVKTSSEVRDAIDSGIPFEVSILNYRKDNTPYMCLIKGFPVHDKRGKLINYIAFEKAA